MSAVRKVPWSIVAVLVSTAFFFSVLAYRDGALGAGSLSGIGSDASSGAGYAQRGVYGAGPRSAPADRTPEEQQTIDVYKKAKDAVVFITTITLTVDPFDVFMEYQPRQGTGSGVVVDAKKAIVLTNLHVIGDAHKIEVTLADGKNYQAHLLGFDRETDIAVLQVEKAPQDLVALDFADSSQLEVGQRVLAIGNPFGLNKTLTTGIVSSLDRVVRSPTGVVLRGLIQTDAAINPGNSGGPLLDSNGRIIGINTAILSQSGDSAGIGFAMPVNHIARVLPEIIATGKVLRAWMGWELIDTTIGPMVLRVFEGGPAASAGIEPVERRVQGLFMRGFVRDFEHADLILKIGDESIKSRDDVERILNTTRGQGTIMVTVRTGGRKGNQRVVAVEPIYR